jgi:hypothetical protein|mmetsp:Transcript_96716/g.153041  ORF Transcript_96716/g.153041 Transcript_96716/m.153041 type:complete len:320 (-) Transcript_96716:345-1304(-)
MACSFCGRLGLHLLSTLGAVVVAVDHDDTHSSVLSEQSQGTGVSLMQSGRSVLRFAGESLLPSNEFFVDSAKEFAMMEDEFDVSMNAPHVADDKNDLVTTTEPRCSFVCVADHVGDPLLYLETLLVLGIFAFARRTMCWAATIAKQSDRSATKHTAAPSMDFELLKSAIEAENEAVCKNVLEVFGRDAARLEDAYGCTALHIAAHRGSVALTRLLIGYGANLNAKEAWEETPLHIAAKAGALEVCEVLLAHGADIDAMNTQDRTALLLAAESDQEATCELLLSRGAGVGDADDSSLPPLLKTLLFRRVLRGEAVITKRA